MDRHVLLTGASRGIGLAIANDLLKEGYKLILTARNEQSKNKIYEIFSKNSEQISVYVVDLSSEISIQEFSKSYAGKLYGIVNNAGICRQNAIYDLELDPFYEILATNLFAPYHLVKYFLPKISALGRVVNISSQLGVEGRANYGAYCASKHALNALTKCWAKELGDVGITVNSVCPGWVSTDMAMQDLALAAKKLNLSNEKVYEDICKPLELKRFNTPQEVSSLVLYLLSSSAGGITGREILMQTVWNQL